MVSLFLKRLFIRLTAGVWLLSLIFVFAFLVVFMFAWGLSLVYDHALSGRISAAQQEIFEPVIALHMWSQPLIIPTLLLLTVIVLGTVVIMALSEELVQDYNSESMQRAQSSIATNMGYETTIQATQEALDVPAGQQEASSAAYDMQHEALKS